MSLFDPGPAAPKPAPLGTDARRTLRQRELIRLGIHPATRRPLADNGQTCRSCVCCERHELRSGRVYFKWPARGRHPWPGNRHPPLVAGVRGMAGVSDEAVLPDAP